MNEAGCKKLVGSLYQLLDGEITEEETEFLQEHLEECGSCLERLGVEMHFSMMVRSRCREEADCPDGLLLEIHNALQAEVSA